MIDQTFSDDSEEYESEEEYGVTCHEEELITKAIIFVYTSIISVCVMSIPVIILYDLSY